jgi:hypothetical protein
MPTSGTGWPISLSRTPTPSSRNGAPDDKSVLVTEYVTPVPRRARRASIKENGGLRHLGALLGRLHTLSDAPGAPTRAGGAWHYLADGSPAEEIAAATRMLKATAETLELGAEEVDRLTALARARPLTLAVWSFCQGRATIADTLAQVAEVTARRSEPVPAPPSPSERPAPGSTRSP